MNRLSLILAIILALGLGACKSHKATVVRATGKPATTATAKTSTVKTTETSVPKNAATQNEYANDKRISSELVKQARTWIGTPYSYGSNVKKKGTDCSGLTMSLFQDVANLKLPRNSAEQCDYCFNVPRNAMQPGDLVFFTSSTKGGRVTHVGLYIGDGKMIHASTSRGVIESGLDEKYYASHYHSSGRVYGITYAATGGKKPKSGDMKDLQLASEGVAAPKAAPKPDKSNKSDKTKKSNKSNKANKTNDAAKAQDAPVAGTTAPVVAEMTLDEYVAKQQEKPQADSVKVEARVDSVAPSAPTVEKQTAESPTMVVNGKVVKATQVEREADKKPKAEPVDTVRSEAIKNEVVKAMKFGK